MVISKRILVALALVSITGCSTDGFSAASSTIGRVGPMPAFYDGRALIINFKEQSANAEASFMTHNMRLNTIFTYIRKIPLLSRLSMPFKVMD